jgi:hypothetical protein
MHVSRTDSLVEALILGAICGAGISAPITTINAISPGIPRPYLYATVVGSYHALGAIISASIIFFLAF